MDISQKFEQGKLLKNFSTFGIGGPARYFIEVHTIEEMQQLLSYCFSAKLPFFIVGKGSNSLFDDRGFNGVAVLNKIGFCRFEDRRVSVGAGYSFSLLGTQTARKGLSGLEFACGIPASVGGAIYMNAGASGSEVCETLEQVEYITEKGEHLLLGREKLFFSYRTSCFQQMKGAIVGATFCLKASEEARKKQLGIIEYRTRTQPYGEKSAGCVFRNPGTSPAGALIEACGLKGKRVGGAEVSLMHANFIINAADATAQDVLALAHLVKETVKEKTGIEMEMEVRLIPYDPL